MSWSAQVEKAAKCIDLTKNVQLWNSRFGSRTLERRGQGIDFQEFRQYQTGDDSKFIDWKASIRSRQLVLRQFVDDKELDVVLVVDSSASMTASFYKQKRLQMLQDILQTLILSSHYRQQGLGFLSFGEGIEKWITPKTGESQLYKLVHEVNGLTYPSKSVNFEVMTRFLQQELKHPSLVVMVSDFLDPLSHELFAKNIRGHQIILIRVAQELWKSESGVWEGWSPEDEKFQWIDAGNRDLRNEITAWEVSLDKRLKNVCSAQVRYQSILSTENYLDSLVHFFQPKRRALR